MARRLLFLIVVIVSFLPSQNSATPSRQFGNVHSITKEQLYDYLSFIASDALEGRDTPSRGLDIAAKYIATRLQRWGYKPAGDSNSYFQQIQLQRSRILASQTKVIIGKEIFSYGQDFIATPMQTILSAPLVYVKNGFIQRAKNINPYEGIDVKGKIMVVLGGFPKGVTYADFAGKRGKDYDTPTNYAKNNGAVGIIYIPSMRQLAQWERNENKFVEKGEVSVSYFNEKEKRDVVIINASQKMVQALFAREKVEASTIYNRQAVDSVDSFDFSPSKKISLNIVTSNDTEYTQNVAGVLEGSDAQLKKEYVAFGAHYDHLGIGEPVNGDSIYNGADDDGSGTTGLLAMAETFAKDDRPKRSLLFIWHVGEEKGLWGSKYFTAKPTIPLSSIIAQLNIDMIGRSQQDSIEHQIGTNGNSDSENLSTSNEVFVIGSKMMSTELGSLTEDVNASFLNLKLNYKFDDPNDPLRLFYRSDHYNYAKQGIPIVFFFDGLHQDYHQVSDEVKNIDFGKFLKVTKTVYVLGWQLANLPKRPAVDQSFPKEAFE